jgi:hypothetical protein
MVLMARRRTFQESRYFSLIAALAFCAFLPGSAQAVTLAWDANPEPDIAGYRLYYGELNAPATTVDVRNTTTHSINNLSPGRRYYFYLTAYNAAALESDPSATIFYDQPEQFPAAPSNLSAVAESPTQVRVQWRDNSTNEAGFRLLRKAGASGAYVTLSTAANVTSYVDSGLTPGTQYFYKAHAYNSGGSSADSAEISVTTPSTPPPIGANTAVFIQSDTTTHGFWRGVYGADGATAANSGFIPPSYVQLYGNFNYSYTWENPSRHPAAFHKLTGTDRFATWFRNTAPMYFNFDFKDTAAHRVSFYFADFDNAGREEKLELFNWDSGQLLASTTISNFSSGVYSTWHLKGRIRAKISGIAGPDAAVSAIFFDPLTPAVPRNSAAFVHTDTQTHGSWPGVYGREGAIAHTDGRYPSYLQLSANNNYGSIWQDPSTLEAAMQKPSGTTRFAPWWRYTNQMWFNFNFTDTNIHRVTFYVADFDNAGREQRLELIDWDHGYVLAETVLSNFQAGVYSSWHLKGRVRARFTGLSGPDAAVSALFFDPPAASTPTPANESNFVGEDTTSGGTWKGMLGLQGHTIATETANLPSYGSVAFFGASTWIWSFPSSDPAALERPYHTGRKASTWFSANPFSANLAFSDANFHRVSLYFLDFDALGRTQRIEVLDGDTGAILDSTEMSDFASGIWLEYDMKGHLTLRITPISGPNAVISGVFFDAVP